MSGGKGGKSSYKSPLSLSISVQGVFIGAIRGYAAATEPRGADIALDEFIETVKIETEKADLSNIGHPNYRPFMARRFGYNLGTPERGNLAYDNVTGKYHAFLQLQEGMRVLASARYSLIDEYKLNQGDTINIEDITMGVRRLFFIEAIEETESGVDLTLIDVLGG